MRRYRVELDRVTRERGYIWVDAESEQDAERKAEETPADQIYWRCMEEGPQVAQFAEEEMFKR